MMENLSPETGFPVKDACWGEKPSSMSSTDGMVPTTAILSPASQDQERPVSASPAATRVPGSAGMVAVTVTRPGPGTDAGSTALLQESASSDSEAAQRKDAILVFMTVIV